MDTIIAEISYANESKKLSEVSSYFFYRYKRYKVDFSMTLFYSKELIEKKVFIDILRKSDFVMQLHKNLICTVFDSTSQSGGFKASENLLLAYQRAYPSQKLYASFVSTFDSIDQDTMDLHLISLLNFAIEKEYAGQIIDRLDDF